jgi:hypothetical protein
MCIGFAGKAVRKTGTGIREKGWDGMDWINLAQDRD